MALTIIEDKLEQNVIFKYIIRVGKTQNDNIFYDVSLEYLGIKKETSSTVPSVKDTSLIKKALVPFSLDNISQSNMKVKSDISTNNMQKDKKYSKKVIEHVVNKILSGL